jgi:hypothetical protein
MEVTVFRYGMTSSVWLLGFFIWMFCWNTQFLNSREQNQVRWEQVNVEFVVEYSAVLNNDKVDVQSWSYWISCFQILLNLMFSFFPLGFSCQLLCPITKCYAHVYIRFRSLTRMKAWIIA